MLSPRDCLDRALERRERSAPSVAPLDAYRCVNGVGDGAYPGVTVDRYGAYVVVQVREGVPEAVATSWCVACQQRLDPAALVLKVVARKAGKSTSRVVEGVLPDGPVVVREGDAHFECWLDDGLQTGLFLDHRDTRQAIRTWAPAVEVLNLFAYTGAFSVHAALAGASRVTSVDSAKRALGRGRSNMMASGLDPDLHRWFTDDVLVHLRRGAAGQYGLVILDPPVLGRAAGRTFSLFQQCDELLAGAIRKLASGGVLVFSTHARRWQNEELRGLMQSAATGQGREILTASELGLPAWDHPVGDDAAGQDRGDYLKTLVLKLA